VRVHLVATPWASPALPSIQTGVLEAHLAAVFGERVPVVTYAPFLTIAYGLAGDEFQAFARDHAEYGEALYLLLYARRYGLPGASAASVDASIEELIAVSQSKPTRLSQELFARLEAETLRFVDEQLAPRLDAHSVNLLGFSTNYDQVFASCFMLRRVLERAPDVPKLFAFGGASILLPEVAELLRRLELDVWRVFGEGEEKLEAVVERLLAAASPEVALARTTLQGAVTGVVHASEHLNLYEVDRRTLFGDRAASLTEQSLPDYDDFFQALSEVSGEAQPTHLRALSLPIEGSRGCFVHCDFCGLNYEWSGFRKKAADRVVASALEASRQHGVPRITFVDNVCDTWAEAFADALLRMGVRLPGFMELRAHHPEAFWTKLALAGVDRIQIGIEALSSPLLARMKKLTRVVQNVAAQKYLVELGIVSGSNLLGHHPLSTVEDVAETKRVVEAIPHLGSFHLSIFRLTIGSPLYDGLSPEERRALVPYVPIPISADLNPWMPGFYYLLPPSLTLSPEVHRAWEEFRAWYREFAERPSTKQASLTVVSHHPGSLVIQDARDGETMLEALLEGESAKVYDACHRPMKAAALAHALKLPMGQLEAILGVLVERRWTLELDGSYLSIALRPRDVLVQNLYKSPPEQEPTTRRVALGVLRA
jgi:hypothetical protein